MTESIGRRVTAAFIVPALTVVAAAVAARSTTSIWPVIAVVVIALAVIAATAYRLRDGLEQPIQRLGEAMASALSSRGTAIRMTDLDGDDEIGELARTLGRLQQSLQEIESVADRVTAGDLAVEIQPTSKDDTLGIAVQKMLAHLNTMVEEITDNSGVVGIAAKHIVSSVENQAATTGEMSASVAEITATMEELSASSTQIAEYSNSVVAIANATLENSRKGAESMDFLAAKMDAIHQDTQTSLAEIVELGRASKEISSVMKIINSIADQTKLIAFNAALEASSAGEAGRRFGVVATEIRRLADSVTESTGEIEARVSQIQDSISRLVVTSEKGASGIVEGMTATSTTTEQLTELVNAAQEAATAAQQISLSTQQQKTASAQVVVALREIVSASTNTADAMTRMRGISQHMMTMSDRFVHIVGTYRLNAEN